MAQSANKSVLCLQGRQQPGIGGAFSRLRRPREPQQEWRFQLNVTNSTRVHSVPCVLRPGGTGKKTLPHRTMSAQIQRPVPVCVFFADTLLIVARTWTECSTSMPAMGQCSSSGSWTERRTPGTTSLSSPPSSVSAAARRGSRHLCSPKLDFWN